MRKKRTFSLIEVIVSLGLLSLLISTLFFWYRNFSQQKDDFNKIKWPYIEERYAHQRLLHIVPKMELPIFTTQLEDNLIFTYNRGPCQIPELSGRVLGCLFYDKSNQALCLKIWPLPLKESFMQTPSQTIIVLDTVSSCSFEFYYPPDPFKKSVDPEEVGRCRPIEGWQNKWRAAFHTQPALVKIVIERNTIEKNRIEYLFDLQVPIVFPKEQSA